MQINPNFNPNSPVHPFSVTVQINLAVVFRIMGDVSRGEDPSLVRKCECRYQPLLPIYLLSGYLSASTSLTSSFAIAYLYALLI